MAAKEISVLVATYRRSPQLRDVLSQLIASDYPGFEIIVVDQAPESHDTEVARFLASIKQRIRYFVTPPAGVASAERFAITKALGEIVLFLDDDVILANDLLHRHASNYDDPTISGVAGLVLAPGQAPTQRHHWLFNSSGLGHHFFSHAFGSRVEVMAAPGANMSFRRKCVIDAGGIDPMIHTHHWELDLCRRVKAAGGKIVHDPLARVIHLGAPGGTHCQHGDSKEYFTDCHYCFLKHHTAPERLLLYAQLFWHRVVRIPARRPTLAATQAARFMQGYLAARKRVRPGPPKTKGQT